MANTVTATIQSSIAGTFRITGALSTTFIGQPKKVFNRVFDSTETTKIYFNSYSVTTSPTSVDLTSLTDAYGVALSFTTVKHLLVANNATSGDLTVGGGTNGLFTTLPFTLNGYDSATNSDDGSCLNLTTPITVDGTHKILTLTASAGTLSVTVFIAGS